MKPFYRILINTLVASATNNFLWFALIFWVYLETRSIIASSIVGAAFPLFSALFGIVFGIYVDRHKKKKALLLSSQLTALLFGAAGLLYVAIPQDMLLDLTNPLFWLFVTLVMSGAVVGNLRMIALSTLVTILVPEKQRDRANGQVGIVNGLSFAVTSVFSGLAIGLLGMGWSLAIGVFITMIAMIDLLTIRFNDKKPSVSESDKTSFGLKGSIAAAKSVPGLPALILFSMINNFLGGVYFALMDPYGLELVSVEVWGFIWGGLSVAFLIGGIFVAKKGLGNSPLRVLLLGNIVMWIVSIIFPLRASILLLVIGMFIYMVLVSVVEAAEQTVLQKVVPLKVQGRIFGLGQTAENLAAPITALLIGPIAQAFFIPYMTVGHGAATFGEWFGTGVNRGIALIFIIAGIAGLVVTVLALRSASYRLLLRTYDKS